MSVSSAINTFVSCIFLFLCTTPRFFPSLSFVSSLFRKCFVQLKSLWGSCLWTLHFHLFACLVKECLLSFFHACKASWPERKSRQESDPRNNEREKYFDISSWKTSQRPPQSSKFSGPKGAVWVQCKKDGEAISRIDRQMRRLPALANGSSAACVDKKCTEQMRGQSDSLSPESKNGKSSRTDDQPLRDFHFRWVTYSDCKAKLRGVSVFLRLKHRTN